MQLKKELQSNWVGLRLHGGVGGGGVKRGSCCSIYVMKSTKTAAKTSVQSTTVACISPVCRVKPDVQGIIRGGVKSLLKVQPE